MNVDSVIIICVIAFFPSPLGASVTRARYPHEQWVKFTADCDCRGDWSFGEKNQQNASAQPGRDFLIWRCCKQLLSDIRPASSRFVGLQQGSACVQGTNRRFQVRIT
jgi:hypothetical protein